MHYRHVNKVMLVNTNDKSIALKPLSLPSFINNQMKRFFFIALTLCVLATMNSCSTKFNTAAPYKNITLIYGILDIEDTAHYIRIEKAFLDDTKSAILMSQVPDSSFYSNLVVKIKLVNNTSHTVDYTLSPVRVDLNNEGYPKQSGTFFTAPNYAYKFKNKLDTSYSYRIVVTNQSTGQVDSSITPIITNDSLAFYIQSFDPAYSAPLSFARTGSNYSYKLSGFAAPYGQMYEGWIRFNWYDSNVVTGVETKRSYDWKFATSSVNYPFDPGTQKFNFVTPTSAIYNAIATGMGITDANTARLLDSCDIYVYAGGNEMFNYSVINAAQNSGLTSDEVKPNYTNIFSSKGAGSAYGLYSTRTMRIVHNVGIDFQTLDSILTNPITSSLNIRGLTIH